MLSHGDFPQGVLVTTFRENFIAVVTATDLPTLRH